MSWSDYRSFGITDKANVSSGTHIPDSGGFIHALAISDTPYTGLELTYPRAGVTQVTTGTILAGGQLAGIKSITITSGLVQLLWFRG